MRIWYLERFGDFFKITQHCCPHCQLPCWFLETLIHGKRAHFKKKTSSWSKASVFCKMSLAWVVCPGIWQFLSCLLCSALCKVYPFLIPTSITSHRKCPPKKSTPLCFSISDWVSQIISWGSASKGMAHLEVLCVVLIIFKRNYCVHVFEMGRWGRIIWFFSQSSYFY